MKYFDSDEALAHIILLRDGRTTIDYVFEKTKFIPQRYINRYSRIANVEDLKQVVYTAHVAAIRHFPINSGINFFGWAGTTIRREIVEHIKAINRSGAVIDRVKQFRVCLLGMCEHPEQEYIAKECSTKLFTALSEIGDVNRREVLDYIGDARTIHEDGTYFKRRKGLSRAISALSEFKSLQEYV